MIKLIGNVRRTPSQQLNVMTETINTAIADIAIHIFFAANSFMSSFMKLNNITIPNQNNSWTNKMEYTFRMNPRRMDSVLYSKPLTVSPECKSRSGTADSFPTLRDDSTFVEGIFVDAFPILED